MVTISSGVVVALFFVGEEFWGFCSENSLRLILPLVCSFGKFS